MATETVQQEARTQTQDADEFASLLKQTFRPRTERAATEIENAVKTLVEQALADTSVIKSDVLDTIGEMIAQLDKKLSAQMNEIMHAPEFQQLEGAWRGMKYLVFQSETDALLKIRVMNVSRPSSIGTCGCIRTPPGTRARFSRRSMKRSSVNSVDSRMAA